MQTQLDSISVTVLNGVGAKLAGVLAKLGVHSLQDLLFHLPHRHLDKTRIHPLGNLVVNQTVVVQGNVLDSKIMFGRRRSLAVKIEDLSGTLMLRFFHFNAAQKNSFEQGRTVRCFGEARLGSSGLEMYHPEYEFIDERQANEAPEQRLTPVYPLTEGLSQARLVKLIEQALTYLDRNPPRELLPDSINLKFGVDSLANALRYIHYPPAETDAEALLSGVHPYQQRLAFEELLAHFLTMQKARLRVQLEHSPEINPEENLSSKFLCSLPFEPTGAQTRVAAEIASDMAIGKPMLRMVQGDVGSGKTLVAALACTKVIAAGYQCALAAPTEILAEQHYLNFSQWFETLGLKVGFLVGKLGAKAKREAIEGMLQGEFDLVVGTHALFQDQVMFKKLGLVIIDEQHRFGVDQRLSLREKTQSHEVPHQLVMTATPIPRTLAMTAFADLDYSIIDELPAGRKGINTAIIAQTRKAEIIARVKQACESGTQAYWVCPLVEDSETLSAANAEESYKLLTEELKPIKVGLVHGRMKPKDKEAVVKAFKNAEISLLVATTVIEVGVDVPNASLMIIENPERLGLAQLHQLRGRVGRGSQSSHCLLVYGEKLSSQAKERLSILRQTNDGFAIAEKDLELRGPGELLGTRQTGDMVYRLADPSRDTDLLEQVHELGRELMESEDPSVQKLIDRWFGADQNYALA